MKGILEYNLNDFDDKREMEAAFNNWKFLAALHDIDNMCREKIKYGDEVLSENVVTLLEQIRAICSIKEEYYV